MNVPVIKKWIDELRSGKWKQGTGSLRPDTDCRCCLGVLCEISHKGRWEAVDNPNFNYFFVTDTLKEEGAELPDEIISWSGLTSRQQQILIQFNDDDGLTFDEIADWLEEKITS